jgi:HemY protein
LQSRQKLLRTAGKVESPLVNYLAAARASYELGDREEAFAILGDAQKKYKHFSVPITLVQVKMEMNDGRYEQARQLLVALQVVAPKNQVLINSLREIYEKRQDWVSLNEIFPHIKKHKLCSAAETLELESSVMVGQLKLANDAAARAVAADRLNVLRKAWSKVPSYQQKIPRVVAAYADALVNHLQDWEAEVIVRKTLSRTWDDRLGDIYGLLRVDDITASIRNAEDWLRYQPHNAVLLRMLGRLSLRNHLWGVARDYFQRSIAAQKNPETYAELARLLNNMGDLQKSVDIYQTALQLSIDPLPDLPQPTRTY